VSFVMEESETSTALNRPARSRTVFVLSISAAFFSTFLISCLLPWAAKTLLPRHIRLSEPNTLLSLVGYSFPAAALGGMVLAFFFVRLRPLRAQAAVYAFVWGVAALIVSFSLGAAIDLPWLWFMPIGLLVALCAANVLVLPSWVWRQQVHNEGYSRDEPYLILAASFLGQFATIADALWIEPNLPLHGQTIVWKAGAALVAILVIAAAFTVGTNLEPVRRSLAEPNPPARPLDINRPTPWRRIRWALLAALPAALIPAAVSYVSANISPLPYLSLVLSALYALSLVFAFGRCSHLSKGGRRFALGLRLSAGLLYLYCGWLIFSLPFRHSVLFEFVWLSTFFIVFFPWRWTVLLQPITTGVALAVVAMNTIDWFLPAALAFLGPAVWFSCWGCHGALANDRPDPVHLPEFVLWISLGVMLAALFSGLVAPLVFPMNVLEFPLCLVLACVVRFLPVSNRG